MISSPFSFFAILFVLECLVGAICLTTYLSGTFWPSQILRNGDRYGLPCAAHGGIIGDLLIVSPLTAYLWSTHGSEWSALRWTAVGLVSLIVTIIMHHVWASSIIRDCLASRGRVTMAGYIHAVYMAACFTVIALYFFCTHIASRKEYWTVCALVFAHEFIGNNKVLDLVKPRWWPDMPAARLQGWAVIAGVTLVMGLRGASLIF